MARLASSRPDWPLAGRIASVPGVAIVPGMATHRMILRAAPAEVREVSRALGLVLPVAPKTSTVSKKGRRALWLGPDEWLLLDERADPAADLAKIKVLHSAVDISHRNTAILVNGAGAQATLEAGCPQDLSLKAFPVGACSRTVLGKIEVVILRIDESAFHVECWRSFSDYAFGFLAEAARDCLA